VDITDYWEGFPSAKKALGNNIVFESIRDIAYKHTNMIQSVNKRLRSFIIEGQLLEEFVLDRVKDLLVCLRDANVTIRWIMLHRHSKNKKFKEVIE
jgi:WASH complex subunit strumpellin